MSAFSELALICQEVLEGSKRIGTVGVEVRFPPMWISASDAKQYLDLYAKMQAEKEK